MRALVLLGLAVVSSFLGLLLWTTDGHFVAQVSDLYVVAQYAKAMAEGHPFQYNAGEAPTTGATSLLHTAILAVAHAAGARGEGLVAFAILLGALLYLASLPLAALVGARLATPREGRLAAALLALSGPVVWGYLYGSDIALFLFLALLLLDRWLAYWGGGSAAGFAVAGSLLALARPEGLPIGVLLAGTSLRRPVRPASGRERLLPWLPVAAGLLVLALQRALTGAWLSTSVSEKSLLPNYGLVETVAVAAKYGVDVLRGLLLGLYPAEAPIGFAQGQAAFLFPPLALLFVLMAAATAPQEVRLPVRAWLAVVAFVFAASGPNVFMGVHFNRYLMWAFPGLLAVAAAGLGHATGLLARGDASLERGLFRAGAGLFVLLGLLSTARFAAVYAEMAGACWRREIPTAAWIRANLPPGAGIANLATSIEYLTGHRNLSLHGVTSPALVGNRSAEREAGLLESLRRLPASERPPWLLLARSGFEDSALLRAFTDGPPVFESASFGDDLVLFRAQWDVLDRGKEPVLPAARAAVADLAEVDRLDVCDAHDEGAHGYGYDSRRGELLLAGSVSLDGVPGVEGMLADGGRLIVGGESFRIRTRPGRDLAIVLRSHRGVVAQVMTAHGSLTVPVEIAEVRLEVRANGEVAARYAAPNGSGWNEHVLRVPAALVTSTTTELTLSGRYAAFRYWFYQ